MPETIQAYLEAVQEQIRWKRARPVLIRELERHLEDQRDDFLKEGKPPEEAERLAVEDMGDPVTVGTELDAVHRPRPQWGLLGLTIALALTGAALRGVFLDASIRPTAAAHFNALGKALASLGLGTAVMLGMYFLDVSRLARHAKVLYIGAAAFGAGMFGYWVSRSVYSPSSAYSLPYYFSQFLPAIYALWVYIWRRKGWKGLLLSIIGGIPFEVITTIHPCMTNLLLFLLTGFVLLFLAAWQDWFGVGRWKGLAVILGTASAFLAWLFYQGYFYLLIGRLRLAFHPELDKLGRGFAGWLVQMHMEHIPLLRLPNSYQNAGIAVGARFYGDQYAAPVDISKDFLPISIAVEWGWIPLLLLLAALAALLLWLLVKGLRQKYLLGRFVVLAAVIPLAVQTLFSVMINFGLILFSASLPLMVGNTQTVADMALIGLALSVFRGDSIAREEPAEPVPRRKHLRIQIEYR